MEAAMSKPVMAALLSCSGPVLTAAEKELFARANPLGISLFSRNIKTPEQLAELVRSVRQAIGRDDVIIAVDQEGGRVRRLGEPHWLPYAAAIDLGALPLPQARRAAELHAVLIAHDLKQLSINMNFAPVLDLIHPDTSPVLKSRCLNASELVVSDLGSVMIQAYINSGICPCIKHLPGYGRANVDPHLHLPQIDTQLSDLAADFLPFQKNAGCPAGMTAHIIIRTIDGQQPITSSSAGIKRLIRGTLNFNGLLISDAIDMHALSGTIAEKARAALAAGCDCICYALGDLSEMEALAAACPPLTDAALSRLEKIRRIISAPAPATDIKKLREEYNRIIGTIEPYCDDYDATEVLNQLKHKGEK